MPPIPTNPAFVPSVFYDGFGEFDAGVNTGQDHDLLPRNQLASGINITVRGGFVTNRPPYRQIALDYGGNQVLKSRVEGGIFQGAQYYKPDSGPEALIASIGGRLFRFDIGLVSAAVGEITITASTPTSLPFTAPAIGAAVQVTVFDTTNLKANYEIMIGSSNYTIQSVDSTTQVTAVNVDAPTGNIVPRGTILQFWDVNPSNRNQAWLWQAEKWMIVNDGQSVPIFYDGATSRRSQVVGAVPELPAARMGAYGMGRVWQSGTDGRTFIAGNIVGGEGGTPAQNFRDAVLKVTENTYLKGGGAFVVPGNVGFIQAMIFTTILDAQLGQGPLAVFTPDIVFSCNAPVDRATWQTITNPILTESQIANGGLSQNGTINVNGDVIYRAEDGIRSLVLGRREFTSWGNVPQSREMNLYLTPDDQTLLGYCSSIYFNNRTLMTFSPSYSEHGVFHRGLIALDGDVLSSMRDKKPAVYDGAWTGLAVLQLVSGDFSGNTRAFAFDLAQNSKIDLWEILPDAIQSQDNFDNGDIPIISSFESPQLCTRAGKVKDERTPARLMNGEMYVTDLVGTAHFQVYYRPDDFPCWTLWAEWSECAGQQTCTRDPVTGCLPINNFQPQYRPRMGFGEPSPKPCDTTTNRPMREGYSFQLRIVVQGHCKVRAVRVMATTIDQIAFSKVICNPPGATCNTVST